MKQLNLDESMSKFDPDQDLNQEVDDVASHFVNRNALQGETIKALVNPDEDPDEPKVNPDQTV
jgi:hypothetical protein